MHPSLEKFKENNILTPYIFEETNRRLSILPQSLHDSFLKEAALFSKWGVRSQEDQVIALKLKTYLPLRKISYPVRPNGSNLQATRDVSKWLETTKFIYQKIYEGLTFNQALEIATSKWDPMEKYDFKNWLDFYQQDAHKKYAQNSQKYLQLHGDGPPMMPWNHLKGKLPSRTPKIPDMDEMQAEDEMNKARQEAEQQQKEDLKNKIKSLDSRLRSALKLISDPNVQKELSKSMDIGVGEWVRQLQDLQRYILLAPLKYASSLEDLIYQRANVLSAKGHPKAGNQLIALAQAAPPPVSELDTPQDTPTEETPPEAPEAPAEGASEEVPEEGTGEDLFEMPDEGLDDSSFEMEDDSAMDEVARRMNPGDHATSDDSFYADDESDLVVVEAQVAPPTTALPPEQPQAPMPDPDMPADIEVSEDLEPPLVEGLHPHISGDVSSDILDSVTIDDVINRLETVSNILKNREIPRQLAIVDLMMDKVGIASYFPSLAEATKSALESNQYMSTRIEDIIAKLRGSIEPDLEIDLTSTPEDVDHTNETLEEVRHNLEEKERSKDNKEINKAKPSAPAQVMPELTDPVEIEQATPQRVAPIQ